MSQHLGYEKYEAQVRNSGNSRNGKTEKTIRSSAGETTLQVPRDRNGEFEPVILKKHQTGSNEIEEKIIHLYGKGLSARDIGDTLRD